MTRTPIPGHISSLRAAEEEQRRSEQEQKRTDTLKDASKKHIDPFTGKGDKEDFLQLFHSAFLTFCMTHLLHFQHESNVDVMCHELD